MTPQEVIAALQALPTWEKWWYGFMLISFVGIRYNSSNAALFVMALLLGLGYRSIA